MLAPLAIRAVLTLVLKSRSLQPTLFFRAFDDRRLLTRVCQPLKLRYGNSSRGAARSAIRRVAKLDVDLTFRQLPVEQAGQSSPACRKSFATS